jgi:hypothetical protein
MKARPNSRRAIPLLIACALSIPQYSAAQSLPPAPPGTLAPPAAAQGQHFTQEQLDRMLAPIALYPDALLSQVLMAAAYPLEVAEASRWCEAHPGLAPDELRRMVADEPWDPSVKSLSAFPAVLDRMDRDLVWTGNVGEAFVGQQPQVMDAIQGLRRRARDAGSLVSNSQQSVAVANGEITIAPRDPAVVYVPTYDPTVVYGAWWWPAPPYYPFYWAPPGGVAWDWGLGFAAGLGLWGVFDWHHHLVNVDVGRYERLYGRRPGDAHWRFDPSHRAGAAFHNPALARTYGRFEAPRAEEFREREAPAGHAFGAERFGGDRAGEPAMGGHFAGGGVHGGGGRR